MAALPGVASLWAALQPPLVPDRGANTHTIPTHFDAGVQTWLASVLADSKVVPMVTAEPALIDFRLLKANQSYLLPLANYQDKVGGPVTIRIRLNAKIGTVTSAYHGVLPQTLRARRLGRDNPRA